MIWFGVTYKLERGLFDGAHLEELIRGSVMEFVVFCQMVDFSIIVCAIISSVVRVDVYLELLVNLTSIFIYDKVKS